MVNECTKLYTSYLRVKAKTIKMNNCLSYFFFEYQAAFKLCKFVFPYYQGVPEKLLV